MFYGRYQIRLFAETLRGFAADRDRRKIDTNHELWVMYAALFDAPDAFANLNPLSQEGREFWGILADASGRKPSEAWKLAAEFADWLDLTYQKSDPLQFEDETCSVLLHGQLYERLRPEGYAILKVLASREREYVSSDALIEALRCGGPGGGKAVDPAFAQFKDAFPVGYAGKKRISRAVSYLPADLRNLIDGQEGRGRRLVITSR